MKIGSRVKIAPGVKVNQRIDGYDIRPEMMFRGCRTVRETYQISKGVFSVKLFNKGMFWYYPIKSLIEVSCQQ